MLPLTHDPPTLETLAQNWHKWPAALREAPVVQLAVTPERGILGVGHRKSTNVRTAWGEKHTAVHRAVVHGVDQLLPLMADFPQWVQEHLVAHAREALPLLAPTQKT